MTRRPSLRPLLQTLLMVASGMLLGFVLIGTLGHDLSVHPWELATDLVLRIGVPVAVLVGAFFLLIVSRGDRRLQRLSEAVRRVGQSDFDPARFAQGEPLGPVTDAIGEVHARLLGEAERRHAMRLRFDQYLDRIVHDLRTPVSSFLLALDEAEANGKDDGTSKALAPALREAMRLVVLADDLRFAFRLEEGLVHAGDAPSTDLTRLVEAVHARARPLSRWSGIALEVAYPDASVRARCHPDLARHAIRNLVDDALHRGSPGGHVAVVLQAAPADRFRLVVTDDGPGTVPTRPPTLTDLLSLSTEVRPREGVSVAMVGAICRLYGWKLRADALQPIGRVVEVTGPVVPKA